MTTDIATVPLSVRLYTELKALRAGRGVASPELHRRIGPALEAACGVTGDDGPSLVRRKVSQTLTRMVSRLPDLERRAARIGLGLPGVPDHIAGFGYMARAEWVATELLERDLRTAQRHLDRMMRRIADELAELPQVPDEDDWYTEELRLALLLDLGMPQLFESRRITAVAELPEIDVSTATNRPHLDHDDLVHTDLDVAALYGGTVTNIDISELDNVVTSTLTFPFPLQAGDSHEYGLVYRFWEGSPEDGLLVVPTRRCERLDMLVRFDVNRPRSLPTRISKLEHAEHDMVELAGKTLDTAVVQDIREHGELRVDFANLQVGKTYGVRWSNSRSPFLHLALS